MNEMNGERNAANKEQAKHPYCLHACKDQALVEIASRERKERKKKQCKYNWNGRDNKERDHVLILTRQLDWPFG